MATNLETRLQAIEKAINDLATALNNVATKKELRAFQLLNQGRIAELDTAIEHLGETGITPGLTAHKVNTNAHTELNDRYYKQTEFLDFSHGSADAGSPIILNSSGLVDQSMIDLLTEDHGSLLGLTDDDHSQYHNDARALTWLGTRSTTDLSEGSNLYYTEARVTSNTTVAGLVTDLDTHTDDATIHYVVSSINHNLLDNLAIGDVHTQYHNDTRGDARYYTQSQFVASSVGVTDAGKPVKLNVSGLIDSTMVTSSLELTATTPVAVNASTGTVGSATTAARGDHRHEVTVAAPATGIGGGNTEGVATSLARSDHDHTLRETSGPTNLTIGSITDGQSLVRSGTTIVGAAAGLTSASQTNNTNLADAVSGRYYYANYIVAAAVTSVALNSNTVYAIPFVSPIRGGTLDKIGIKVVSAAAAGKVAAVGIYAAVSATSLYPGALLLDAGTVAIDSAVAVYKTISYALTGGTLYFLVVAPNAIVTIRAMSRASHSQILGHDNDGGLGGDFGDPDAGYSLSNGGIVLPNPYTAGASVIYTAPIIAVRYSA